MLSKFSNLFLNTQYFPNHFCWFDHFHFFVLSSFIFVVSRFCVLAYPLDSIQSLQWEVGCIKLVCPALHLHQLWLLFVLSFLCRRLSHSLHPKQNKNMKYCCSYCELKSMQLGWISLVNLMFSSFWNLARSLSEVTGKVFLLWTIILLSVPEMLISFSSEFSC